MGRWDGTELVRPPLRQLQRITRIARRRPDQQQLHQLFNELHRLRTDAVAADLMSTGCGTVQCRMKETSVEYAISQVIGLVNAHTDQQLTVQLSE